MVFCGPQVDGADLRCGRLGTTAAGKPTGRNPSFWLVMRTRTCNGYGALLKIVIGISPWRAVKVID